MTDILQEVLNDAQDEKRILIFRRILPIIIILTLIIAGAIISWGWYEQKLQQRYEKTGDLLLEIIENADSANILPDFINNSDNRQVELAQLFNINQLITSGKKQAAYAILDKVLAEKSYSNVTKSYAHLLWLNLIIEEDQLSDQQKGQARDHMQYFTDQNQLFFANANILKALFYQKVKQYDLAVQHAELVLHQAGISTLIKDQAKSIIANIKYYMLD